MTTETYSTIDGYYPALYMDPNAVLDFTFDWTDWHAAISDTLSSKTVAANGVTVDSSSATTLKVTVWLSAPLAGVIASVTCHIVTAGARTDDRTIYLVTKDR